MSNGANKILNAIMRTAESEFGAVDFMEAVVVTVDPLSVKFDNQITLPASFFIVGQMCREVIQAGSKVLLISNSAKKRFYMVEVIQ